MCLSACIITEQCFKNQQFESSQYCQTLPRCDALNLWLCSRLPLYYYIWSQCLEKLRNPKTVDSRIYVHHSPTLTAYPIVPNTIWIKGINYCVWSWHYLWGILIRSSENHHILVINCFRSFRLNGRLPSLFVPRNTVTPALTSKALSGPSTGQHQQVAKFIRSAFSDKLSLLAPGENIRDFRLEKRLQMQSEMPFDLKYEATGIISWILVDNNKEFYFQGLDS